MKISMLPLVFFIVPLQPVLADSMTNEEALLSLKNNVDEISIVANMAVNCSEAIDNGYFNTARDVCGNFLPAFTEVYEKNKEALDYSFNDHEGGLESFCNQDDEILSICINNGKMMEAYQMTLRANELGAFN